MLDNLERVRQRHAESPSNFAGATEHDPNNGNNDDIVEPEADDANAQPNELHPVQKRKRPSDLFDEEEEDSSREDRKKFVAAALPWAIQDAIAPIELSANLRRTNAILDNISRDPKSAKRSLFNSPSRPQFPESEWVNILAGHAVDMDHVFSNLFAIVHDD
jgi:hypothetical protein